MELYEDEGHGNRGWDYWAVASGERANLWRSTFGDTRLPIEAPIPTQAHLPGLGQQLVLLVKTDLLTQGERQGLVDGLGARFGLSVREAEAEFAASGCPIVSGADVRVVIYNAQRWFT